MIITATQARDLYDSTVETRVVEMFQQIKEAASNGERKVYARGDFWADEMKTHQSTAITSQAIQPFVDAGFKVKTFPTGIEISW